jgi:hypothetical protein
MDNMQISILLLSIANILICIGLISHVLARHGGKNAERNRQDL